jgi:hypothetical protein
VEQPRSQSVPARPRPVRAPQRTTTAEDLDAELTVLIEEMASATIDSLLTTLVGGRANGDDSAIVIVKRPLTHCDRGRGLVGMGVGDQP